METMGDLNGSEILGGFPEGFFYHKCDWHFLQRLFSRFGLVLEYGELADLKKAVFERDPLFWRSAGYRQTDGNALGTKRYVTQLCIVQEDDGQKTVQLNIVFNPSVRALITVLTPSMTPNLKEGSFDFPGKREQK